MYATDFFICQTPTNEIKLNASMVPNKAGYPMPNFLMKGEKILGKPIITKAKATMHIMVIATGLTFSFTVVLLGSHCFYRVEL